jgi:amino acid adenylation domain-containing protein
MSSSRPDPPLSRGESAGSAPLSYAQQRLWFLHELNGSSQEYHIPEAFRLRGELDAAALMHSIQAIAERHEVLRTRFVVIDGEAVAQAVPAMLVEVPLTDLRPLPEPARDEVVTSALAQEWERPFDLASGPLLRARLLRLADRDHALILTAHHLVSDGWSQAILHWELQTLYDALREGRTPALATPAIQYADFARWQRRRQDGAAMADELAYWKEHLAGLPQTLRLPADRPRAAAKKSPARLCRLAIDGGLLAALRELSRASGATLYMTMLAVFAVLLSRHSGQRDVAVGTPIANRTKAQLEPLVGLLVNTLVMRIGVPDEMRFSDYLETVRQTALQAYQHQDTPFERIVQELSPERRLDQSPLFQAMFTLQTMQAATTLRLGGLAVESVEMTHACTPVDLELYAWERPDQVTLAWAYDQNLFDSWRMEQMARHYVKLLDQVSQDPGIPLAGLELLGDREREWLTGQRGAGAEVPAGGNVYTLFAEQAARSPAAVAVRQDRRQVSYAELEQRAGRIARLLAARGAVPGRRVGIATEPGIEFVVAILAALRCGAAYVPLAVGQPPERLAFMMDDAAVELLLTSSAFARQLPPAARQMTIPLDSMAETGPPETGPPETGPAEAGPGEAPAPGAVAAAPPAAYVAYTPGPAGPANGVEITHAGLWNELVWVKEQFGLRPGDRVLQRMPAESGPAAVEILAPLAAGAELAVARPDAVLDVQYLLEFIRREEITVIALPPSLLRRFVRHRGLRHCTSLRCVISGGEILPLRLRQEFSDSSGARLWNTYGATEMTAHGTCYDSARRGGYASVPIGRPIANTAVLVLDERMRLVPKGVPGVLHVAGIGVAAGYLDRPGLTAARFVADPFHPGQRLWRTGDEVRWGADGELEYLGRADDQVKVDGRRIELGEIEAVLRRRPDIAQAAALAREDEPGERRIVAYVVLTGPAAGAPAQAAVAELTAHLRLHLPSHLVPAMIVPLARMPVRPGGGVDRRSLPAPRPEGETVRGGPTSEEEVLCCAFGEVLGLGRVGLHDNFFALGGHSLMAMSLIVIIQDKLGAELAVRDIFEAPTPAQLAVWIRS